MNIDTIRIGKNILARRKEKGLTQQQLADILGVTNKAVSKWETGEGLPDISTLPALAEVLNTTIDSLLCVEEPAQKDEGLAIKHILQKKTESFQIQCLIAGLICVVGVLLAWVVWKVHQTYYAVGLGIVLELAGLTVYEIFLLKLNNQLIAYNSTAIQPEENPCPRKRFYSITVWAWSVIPLWYLLNCSYSRILIIKLSSWLFNRRADELITNILTVITYLFFCSMFTVFSIGYKKNKNQK